RDLAHAGTIEVEGTRIRRHRWCRLRLTRPRPRRRPSWRGRVHAGGRPARKRARPRRGGNWRGRLLAIEAIEPLGGVGETGAPLTDAEPGEKDRREEHEQLELRARVAHCAQPATTIWVLLEC